MSQVLEFDSNKKSYQLGKNGPTVWITTNDPELPGRVRKALSNIQNDVPKFLNAHSRKMVITNNVGNVSTGNIQKDLELLSKADNYVKSQIDYIFGYEVSKDIFGVVSAFTVDDKTGEYLFERLINVFIPVINEEYKTSVTKMKSRIKKYSDRKGTHPALRK